MREKQQTAFIGENVGGIEIAPLLNCAGTPFSLEGEDFPTLQSFVLAVSFPEKGDQKTFRETVKLLEGKALYSFISRSKTYIEGNIYWDGKTFRYGDPAHWRLLNKAVCAKVAEHLHVREALLSTSGSRLVFQEVFALPSGFDTFIARVYERLRDGILSV